MLNAKTTLYKLYEESAVQGGRVKDFCPNVCFFSSLNIYIYLSIYWWNYGKKLWNGHGTTSAKQILVITKYPLYAVSLQIQLTYSLIYPYRLS